MIKRNLVMCLCGGVLLLLLVWASLATRGFMLIPLSIPSIGLLLWLDLFVRGDSWAWWALAALNALAALASILFVLILLWAVCGGHEGVFPAQGVVLSVATLPVAAFLITLRLLLSDSPSDWPRA